MSTVIGLDIGFETVKMVSLSPAGKKWRLDGMAIGNCPKDSWKPDQLNNVDEIAEAVKATMKAGKPHAISGRHAMVALPESVIFSATFSVPYMADPELKQALPLMIAEKLSIEIDEYHFDYEEIKSQCNPVVDEILPPKKEPAAAEKVKDKGDKPPEPGVATDQDREHPNIAIFAIAAKKTLIASIIELCKKADLSLAGIDIKPGAIARAVVDSDDQLPRLIIDMGVGGTGASIAEGKSLRVTSIIPWGTNVIGENINGPVENLRATAAPVFDELIHITRFFENRVCPGVKIKEIIISGSGANITNLADTFKQETGLPTKLANPFAKIETSHFEVPKQLFHTFSDAIGLAMRDIK